MSYAAVYPLAFRPGCNGDIYFVLSAGVVAAQLAKSKTTRGCEVSYDLVFWSESTGTQRDPRVIMNDLFDEKTAAGVDTLPLEEILERVNEHFPLTTDGGLTFWDGETEGMFEMYHSSQHLHFCCRGLLHNHCNTLIEIMAEFKCPLYDPQENRRFCIPREGG